MKEMRSDATSNARENDAVRVPHHSESAREIIRDAAWLGAGIIRSESALAEGLNVLDAMESEWEADAAPSLEQLETSNLLLVARMILQCARKRLESRGAHYRSDYPQRNDTRFRHHSWANNHGEISIGPPPR